MARANQVCSSGSLTTSSKIFKMLPSGLITRPKLSMLTVKPPSLSYGTLPGKRGLTLCNKATCATPTVFWQFMTLPIGEPSKLLNNPLNYAPAILKGHKMMHLSRQSTPTFMIRKMIKRRKKRR